MQGVVIGGGIIGLSIAWRLAQSGASVTLFEAGRIGNEASWAGAGMLAPGGEYIARSAWSEMALHSLQLYPEYVEHLTAAASLPVDFRACGAFEIATTSDEADALQRRAGAQNAIGIYSEQFHPGRVPGVRGDVVAVQYYPFDAVVNPRDLTRALLVACRRAGVRIEEGHPIDRIDGEWSFDFTVIAAGAWSGDITLAAIPLPASMPVRGHLIAFDEDTGLCDAIVRHGSTYLLRRSGNVIVAGASTEQVGFDRRIDGSIAAGLALRAGKLMPALASRSYVTWNGFRPASESGEPVIGRVPDSNIWLAYGHYRNGILLAPATAERIAGEIMQASLQMDSAAPTAHL